MSKYIKQLGEIDRSLIKAEINSLAIQDSNETIESGKFDMLKVYIELKRYETYLNTLIKNIKSTALEIAKQEDQLSFQYNNAQVRISNRTKWDYSIDEEWNHITDQIKALNNLRKERESFLLVSNKEGKLLDKGTGELVEDFKLPFRTEKGIRVTLKIDKDN